MADLALTRTPGDRRRFALDGIGTLRLEGFLTRAATAEARGRSWRMVRRGLLGRRFEMTDAAGTVVAEFEPNGLRRGGTLRWGGRDYALRAASVWRERYALADGDHELALLDGKSWGRQPVRMSVDDAVALDAGLLLFAAFVVRGLAEDASGGEAGGVAAVG